MVELPCCRWIILLCFWELVLIDIILLRYLGNGTVESRVPLKFFFIFTLGGSFYLC
jgi:hypothetical protein